MAICSKAKKVIFRSELDAKLALVFKSKSSRRREKSYYGCSGHYHLTSRSR